jgi:uncharacterized protein YecT (DUF1311 family)
MRLRGCARAHPRTVQAARIPPFLFALIFAGLFAFRASAAERSDACDAASSQAEINACAAERYERADRELNAIYGTAKARLRGKRASALTRAQAAWIRFRDLECELESSSARGGSAYAAVHNVCLSRLTTARIEDLKRLMQDI